MDRVVESVHDINMGSNLHASQWLTAKSLHQIQILSCDLCDFDEWDCDDHCAPFWRLYWHDRNGAEIRMGAETIEIHPSRIILIPPNTHFSSHLQKPVRQLFLHFLVEPRYRMSAGAVFQFPARAYERDLRRDIENRIKDDPADIRLSFLCQMLVASVMMVIPSAGWAKRFEDPRITPAVESIQRAYPARLGNDVLAKEAEMHPSSFIRLFRKCTGHTPLEYLTNLRLEEACSMLHFDEASLEEIAEKTGFGDRAYFTRVFSRDMNCSPARYRKLVNVSSRLRPGD